MKCCPLKSLILVFLLWLCLRPCFGGTAVEQIQTLAEELRPALIAQRRDFHSHPELSNREQRTAGIVVERLRALGLEEIRTNVAHHGVIALLKGGKPGLVVAMRADMDALPITERSDKPYKSLTAGVMHACGHDVHTTVGLGTAEVLSKMRAQMPGTIKFIFQPAEEGAPDGEEGGARLLIKEGALENPRPVAIFGLHTTTEIDAGKIGYRAGGAQASADSISLAIHGKSAHAADPEKGIDAIVVAAQCVSAVQAIKSRRISTFEPLVITFGTIHGGKKINIIADEVKLGGTIRCLSEQTRKQAKEAIRQTIEGVCAAYGASFELQFGDGINVVYNDPALVERSIPSFQKAVGLSNVLQADLRMGAEDFCAYQQVIPGFLFRLGSGNKAKGIVADGHSDNFDVDEECLVSGVKAMSSVLFEFLERQGN